jgi:hypothetical protein
MRFLRATLILLTLTAPALARGPLERAEKFRPDVYPCKFTAAEGAARRVVDALNGSLDFTENEATIVVAPGGMCEQATGAVADVLREHFGGAEIVVGAPPAPVPATRSAASKKLVTIRPSATEARENLSHNGGATRERITGTVTLAVSGGGVERSFTTKFEDKCWAADFKSFASRNPTARFILAESPKLASSEAAALASARQAAAKAVWDPLSDELDARNGKRPDKVTVSQGFVLKQVESMLKQGKCVEDTFVQRLDGPSGTVWRASMLVSLSPANMDQMVAHVGLSARATVAAQQARRVERAQSWGSVAAFLAVIVLLYALVNSLTKGYFMWRLRAGALLLTIVGILVALAVT